MPVMTYKNGAWSEVQSLLIHNGSVYTECQSAKVYEQGVWKRVYPPYVPDIVLWDASYYSSQASKVHSYSTGGARTSVDSKGIALNSPTASSTQFYIDTPVDVTLYNKLWISSESVKNFYNTIDPWQKVHMGCVNASDSPIGMVEITQWLNYLEGNGCGNLSVSISSPGDSYIDISHLRGVRCFMAYIETSSGATGFWRIQKVWLTR